MSGKHKYDPITKNKVIPPAVKYVTAERLKPNKHGKNQDELDSEIEQTTTKAEGVAIPDKGYIYYNPIHQQRVYLTEKEVNLLAEKLVVWALNDPEALKITLFFNDKGISWSVVKDLKERHQSFRTACEIAIQAIGDRRELGAIKRELSEGIIKFTLPLYDPEIRKMEMERALLRLKAEEEADKESRTRYIIMPAIPETDMVKKLPNDKAEYEEK